MKALSMNLNFCNGREPKWIEVKIIKRIREGLFMVKNTDPCSDGYGRIEFTKEKLLKIRANNATI